MLINFAFLFLNVNLRRKRYAWTCRSIWVGCFWLWRRWQRAENWLERCFICVLEGNLLNSKALLHINFGNDPRSLQVVATRIEWILKLKGVFHIYLSTHFPPVSPQLSLHPPRVLYQPFTQPHYKYSTLPVPDTPKDSAEISHILLRKKSHCYLKMGMDARYRRRNTAFWIWSATIRFKEITFKV